MSFPAKISIQTLVAGVHAYEVPNFKSDFIAIHLKNFVLVVGANCALVVLFEEVTYEAVDYRGFANGCVAQHYYLE